MGSLRKIIFNSLNEHFMTVTKHQHKHTISQTGWITHGGYIPHKYMLFNNRSAHVLKMMLMMLVKIGHHNAKRFWSTSSLIF